MTTLNLRAALEAMADRWEQEADGRVADIKADAGSLLTAGVMRSHAMSVRAALAAPRHGDHPRDAYLYDGCPGCAPLRTAADTAPLDPGEAKARAIDAALGSLVGYVPPADPAPLDGLTLAIEAEWYNGNMSDETRDRLLAFLAKERDQD